MSFVGDGVSRSGDNMPLNLNEQHQWQNVGWNKLNEIITSNETHKRLNRNSFEFLRRFFMKFFVDVNGQVSNVFARIEKTDPSCFQIQCKNGPCYPQLQFPECELTPFYNVSIGALFAKLFASTCRDLKSDDATSIFQKCSSKPGDICLNPHHYDFRPPRPSNGINQILPDSGILVNGSSMPGEYTLFPRHDSLINTQSIGQVRNEANTFHSSNDYSHFVEDVNQIPNLLPIPDQSVTHSPDTQNSESQNNSKPAPLSNDASPENRPSTAAEFDRQTLERLKQKATRQEWWCSISYYELADRVGEVWNAPTSMPNIVIDGYTNPNDGAGAPNRFSLGLLTNINRRPESDNSRRYIGKGCSIVTENNNVWLMNDSESSIFVQSPICNMAHNWHPATVVKIPNGCSIKIFENEKYEETLCSRLRNGYEDAYNLVYVCKLRISFVKGWGALYQRQTVTACPCWVELRLNNPLGLLDVALKELQPVDRMSSMS